MSQFYRALRLTLRYRWTLIGTFACSLLVAVLWGGNIGALWPVFEIVLKDQSLQEWVDREIGNSRKLIHENRQAIQLLEKKIPLAAAADRQKLELQLEDLRFKQQAELHRTAHLNRVGPFIHRFIPHDKFRTIVFIVVVLMASTAVKDLVLVGSLVLSARLNQLVTMDLQRQFFGHTLRLDPKVFGQRGVARMMGHMNSDITGVTNGLNHLFGGAIREPLKIIVCFAGALYICWRLMAFSMVLAPLAIISTRLLAASIRRANHRALKDGVALSQVVYEAFCGLQTVQSFTMEKQEQERFNLKSLECMHKAMKIAFYNALTKPVTELLGIGIVCGTLILGAYLVLNKETAVFGIQICNRPLATSQLLVFYAMLIGMSDPARKLSEIFSAIQGGIAAAERLYPILDTQPLITDPRHPRPAPRPHRTLTFEDVSFAYTPDQPVLRNINLEIKYGESIAIVGPNGCGKSTLINLISRFYDPVQGAVRLDGIDLREIGLFDLRSLIGVVSQQHQLFDETVLNNIRYGSPAATREQVIEASKKAHAHRFIESQLEHGYETVIGESGGRLSGGQRQRIALARAILRNPDILILDEATSQVDLESEQLIHKVLEEFMHNRTAIVVTHRLSTLALCERILVMEGGRILDCGDHDALLRRCDLYRRLHEIHFRKSA